MSVEPENGPQREDENPRQGFLTTMPKRSFYRVVLLLAMLAGILYLRQQAGSMAGCMANALGPALAPTQSAAPVRARVMIPPDLQEGSR